MLLYATWWYNVTTHVVIFCDSNVAAQRIPSKYDNKTPLITDTYSKIQQITISPKTSLNTCFIKKQYNRVKPTIKPE